MAPALSVCLVTRNDEGNLPRVLGSVAGVADEVVVVDTGSSDRTAALAADRGARVIHFAWQDDFAAARNQALAQARGAWVLWLNPDEELASESREAAKARLLQNDVLAYFVTVQEIARADRPDAFTVTEQPRLFRRLPEVRYIGRLHPSFAVALQELAARAKMQVVPADIVIRHHAYLSVLTEAKLRWAARLLELELADRPGQLHYLIEYGQTLLRLHDARGHAVLAEAAERLAPSLGDPMPPVPGVGRLLDYLLTAAPEGQGKITREDVLCLVERWFPAAPPLLWAAAQYRFQRRDFRRAAEYLGRLVECGRSGVYDRSAAFDPSIIGAGALLNLGGCLIQLGEAEQAVRCLEQIAPDSPLASQAGALLARLGQGMPGAPPARGEGSWVRPS